MSANGEPDRESILSALFDGLERTDDNPPIPPPDELTTFKDAGGVDVDDVLNSLFITATQETPASSPPDAGVDQVVDTSYDLPRLDNDLLSGLFTAASQDEPVSSPAETHTDQPSLPTGILGPLVSLAMILGEPVSDPNHPDSTVHLFSNYLGGILAEDELSEDRTRHIGEGIGMLVEAANPDSYDTETITNLSIEDLITGIRERFAAGGELANDPDCLDIEPFIEKLLIASSSTPRLHKVLDGMRLIIGGPITESDQNAEPTIDDTDSESQETDTPPKQSKPASKPTARQRPQTAPQTEKPQKEYWSGRGGSDTMSQYLREIGKYILLTAKDERELAQTIEAGKEARGILENSTDLDAGRIAELKRAARKGDRAKERFVQANLRLVVSVAKRFPVPVGMELLDLVQEGNLGMEHAVDKFDWRKGFKFSTYATFWIRQAIGRAIDQSTLVRLPGDKAAELRAAMRRVEGDEDELDDPEMLRLNKIARQTSLNKTVGDNGDQEISDLYADPNADTAADALSGVPLEIVEELMGAVAKELGPRTLHALRMRFKLIQGDSDSKGQHGLVAYRVIGEELGITAEATRRLIKRGMAVMAQNCKDRGITFENLGLDDL